MAGKYSRNKGYRGENELSNMFQNDGIVCYRVPLSGAGSIKGDLVLSDRHKVEVKRRAKLPHWIVQMQDCNFGAMREDRGDWQMVVPYQWFIRAYKLLNNPQ